LKNNLIKGGDLQNAIVIIEKETSQEELDHLSDLFHKPRVEVKSRGILNPNDLTFPNEPARHKLLDLLGDLSLIGMPIKGKILATRPGHASNVEFAKKIRKIIKEKPRNPILDINMNENPVYDVNQIMKLLPHRPPFLLVDKILQMTKNDIVGLKNVTMNEGFFVGHFPQEPIMPGVLQIEAMAQVGGILVLSTMPDPENYSTYFLTIEKAKFRSKVVPGDTLIFRVEFAAPIRRGIVVMRGEAYVGDKMVMESEMMAQIIKNKK